MTLTNAKGRAGDAAPEGIGKSVETEPATHTPSAIATQSYADPGTLNDETHLYRHFNKDGELLYVGISFNALCRLRQHAEVSTWFDEISRVEIEKFPSREAALKGEREAIKRETPRHNIHHKSAAPHVDPSIVNKHLEISRADLFVQICRAVYRIEEAAQELGIRPSEVDRLISSGKLGYVVFPPALDYRKPSIRITGWQLIDYLEYLMRGNARPAAQAPHPARTRGRRP